ncbi:RDD family protein [Mucilaginibacter myungsuensis]|uniref:RDD family protein n=1 Tax=Mucilaginibacter myungsuensis TaxID=649104 RepID=A0A929PW14_9SPHI|nr:RDD family protein [Mucilaginibacter myungsuensis]MBE9660682.1 RDD family protein [Mucilaginibacter myungsuensis]MDN3600727.1 RDD family protein [Mucilaginibacter myungsuensis]
METVKITTSQNVDIDYAVASLGERIAARVVDYLLFIGATLVVYIPTTASGFKIQETAQWVIGIIWLSLFLFYDLVAEMFFNGQSIGKRIVKIRVISLDGGRPSVGQFVMRWLFRILDFGVTLGSLAVLSVAFSDKRQRIGDISAGTTVVKTKPVNPHQDLFYSLPDDDYKPTFPEVTQLSDKDINLVYDVIRNFNYTRNSKLVYTLAVRIKEHLNITYPPDLNVNEYQFLQLVVNDYNAIAARNEA